MKYEEFLGQLRDCQPVRLSAQWNYVVKCAHAFLHVLQDVKEDRMDVLMPADALHTRTRSRPASSLGRIHHGTFASRHPATFPRDQSHVE